MAFEKAVRGQIIGVSVQDVTIRLPLSGSSIGNAFTNTTNLLRGSKFWDTAAFWLTEIAVAGGATGGSYTVTLETDAIAGQTALPIAQLTGLGPNSATVEPLTKLHGAPGAATPTHISITRVAGGGGITFKCYAACKQSRGVLSSGGGGRERVLEGILFNSADNLTTNNFDVTTGGELVMTVTGASANFGGLDKMTVWDQAHFWAVQNATASSGYSFAINASTPDSGGTTWPIAITQSELDTSGTHVAFQSTIGGVCPTPSTITYTEESAGDGLSSCLVVFVAKSNRGTLAG